MSVGFLVRVFTSIVDTVSLTSLATKAVLPSGVTTTRGALPGRGGSTAFDATIMSAGFFVLVFTSIVHTVAPALVTNAGLPSGATAHANGPVPTAMSVGFLVRVPTSMVESVPLRPLVTKAVVRHRARTGTADTLSGTTPTSAPANPSTTTARAHRNRIVFP